MPATATKQPTSKDYRYNIRRLSSITFKLDVVRHFHGDRKPKTIMSFDGLTSYQHAQRAYNKFLLAKLKNKLKG